MKGLRITWQYTVRVDVPIRSKHGDIINVKEAISKKTASGIVYDKVIIATPTGTETRYLTQEDGEGICLVSPKSIIKIEQPKTPEE